MQVWIDADACPVKQEVYKVAGRYELPVTLVANSWMRIPDSPRLHLEVVGDGFDEADDWIVERVQAEDIVITADILLADRCLKQGARVLGNTGHAYTAENIGQALATRELMAELRGAGTIAGGPAPMQKSDRSRFLQELDAMIQSIRRQAPPTRST